MFYWTDSTEGALVTFARITLSSNLLRGLLFKRYKPSIYLNPRGAKGFRVLIRFRHRQPPRFKALEEDFRGPRSEGAGFKP